MATRPEDPRSPISPDVSNEPISVAHLDELKLMIRGKTQEGALKFNNVVYHTGQDQIRNELKSKNRNRTLFSDINVDYIYQPAKDKDDDSNYYIVIGARGNIYVENEDYFRLVLRMVEPAIETFSDLQDYAFVYGFFRREKIEEKVIEDKVLGARIAVVPYEPKADFDKLVGGPLYNLLLTLEVFNPSIHPSIAGLIDIAGIYEIEDEYVSTFIPDTLKKRPLSIARDSFNETLTELIK